MKPRLMEYIAIVLFGLGVVILISFTGLIINLTLAFLER